MSCLMDRLGGELAVEDFVDSFYDGMNQDNDLRDFFKKYNLQVLKDRTVDYLCSELAFGKAHYRGPDLFVSHMHLKITCRHFDIMMKCIKTKLKKMKVSKQTAGEVMVMIEKMRDPICDPTGSLREAADAKIAELKRQSAETETVDPTGFGMSVKKETAEKWKEDERKRAELKDKLAAVRQRRMQEQFDSHTRALKHKAKGSAKKNGQPKVDISNAAGPTYEQEQTDFGDAPACLTDSDLHVDIYDVFLPYLDGLPEPIPVSNAVSLLQAH